MKLSYRRLTPDSPDLSFTKVLFERAFPAVERPPFRILIGWEKNELYEISSDGEPVGLIDLLTEGDLTYIFFLAIAGKKRNLGIGSKVLQEILEKEAKKGHRVYLLAEEPEPHYEDYPLRQRRIGFYERNGFILTGIRICEYEVYYRLLKAGPYKVTGQEFLSSMKYVMGEKNYQRYYTHHVSVEEE